MKKLILSLLFGLSIVSQALAAPVQSAGELNADTLTYPSLNPADLQWASLNRDIAKAYAVNMQTTATDVIMRMVAIPATWRAIEVYVDNCSASATGATISIYTAASAGGTGILVAGTSPSTEGTIAPTVTTSQTATQLYLRLVAGSSGAATCDITLIGRGRTL